MPLPAVIWMCSLEDRLLFFEDGVTLTLTDGRRSAWLPFPPSKYSINNDVCDLLFESSPLSRSLSLFLRLVAILMGLPSEGRVYEERSVAFLIRVIESNDAAQSNGITKRCLVGAEIVNLASRCEHWQLL